MIIRINSLSGKYPEYETTGSSGMDIRAYIDEPVVIKPWSRCLVPTGLFVEMEEGYEIQIRARSGLAIKHGIGLVNGIGTIDSDYRGEIKVPLINMSDKEFEINNGDRIAQIVAAKVEKITFEATDELGRTERGTGGFGHTGI